jgi:hypothetical protein
MIVRWIIDPYFFELINILLSHLEESLMIKFNLLKKEKNR